MEVITHTDCNSVLEETSTFNIKESSMLHKWVIIRSTYFQHLLEIHTEISCSACWQNASKKKTEKKSLPVLKNKQTKMKTLPLPKKPSNKPNHKNPTQMLPNNSCRPQYLPIIKWEVSHYILNKVMVMACFLKNIWQNEDI